MTSSRLSSLPMATKAVVCSVLLIVGEVVIIFSSSIFMLSPLSNQCALGTFPGENGKIVFRKAIADGDKGDIYVMNADGSEQTRLTTERCCVVNNEPDWGPAELEEDTTPPIITVPDDITEEATSADGAEVSFEVSAEDDVDGAVDVKL